MIINVRVINSQAIVTKVIGPFNNNNESLKPISSLDEVSGG